MLYSIHDTLEGSSNIVLTPVSPGTTVDKQQYSLLTRPVEIRTTLRMPSEIFDRSLVTNRLPSNECSCVKNNLRNKAPVIQLDTNHSFVLKTRATEPEAAFTEDTRRCHSLAPAQWDFGIVPLITVTAPTPLQLRSDHPPMCTAVQWVCDRVPMITITPPSPLLTHLRLGQGSLSSSDSDTEISRENQHSCESSESPGWLLFTSPTIVPMFIV